MSFSFNLRLHFLTYLKNMKKRDDSTPSTDKISRRRGRPAGKNRVPLSLTERRARNAQYERERRIETAQAMAQLAEAACCDPQITNADLLATVISQIQNATKRQSSKSIENLKQMNEDLESQIAELQNLLGNDPDLEEKCLSIDSDGQTSQETSDSDSESCDKRPSKYCKTSKEDTVHHTSGDNKSNSSQTNLSSDSQDSVWSHHQFGKTVPTQRTPQLTALEGKLERSSSPQIEKSESLCTEWRERTSSEKGTYSENSNLSKIFSEHPDNQRDVEFHNNMVPEQCINSEPSVDDQSHLVFTDPFTEREKAILERLGCSDFINFQDIYCDDQSQPFWPIDYARY